MSMQLNIWAELSYEFGPSRLISLGRVGMGRVGMGRVLCGPRWHGPSWFLAELSVIPQKSCLNEADIEYPWCNIENGISGA